MKTNMNEYKTNIELLDKYGVLDLIALAGVDNNRIQTCSCKRPLDNKHFTKCNTCLKEIYGTSNINPCITEPLLKGQSKQNVQQLQQTSYTVSHEQLGLSQLMQRKSTKKHYRKTALEIIGARYLKRAQLLNLSLGTQLLLFAKQINNKPLSKLIEHRDLLETPYCINTEQQETKEPYYKKLYRYKAIKPDINFDTVSRVHLKRKRHDITKELESGIDNEYVYEHDYWDYIKTQKDIRYEYKIPNTGYSYDSDTVITCP